MTIAEQVDQLGNYSDGVVNYTILLGPGNLLISMIQSFQVRSASPANNPEQVSSM
jgi:hypothetical protein